jgi:hypothetical protein
MTDDDIWREFYATAPASETGWNERLMAADEYLRTTKRFVKSVPKVTPAVAKMLSDAYKQVEDIHSERREWYG